MCVYKGWCGDSVARGAFLQPLCGENECYKSKRSNRPPSSFSSFFYWFRIVAQICGDRACRFKVKTRKSVTFVLPYFVFLCRRMCGEERVRMAASIMCREFMKCARQHCASTAPFTTIQPSTFQHSDCDDSLSVTNTTSHKCNIPKVKKQPPLAGFPCFLWISYRCAKMQWSCMSA